MLVHLPGISSFPAAEAAATHIQAGADVLTGSAQQVVGAIGVASEQGIPWMGTQSDQSSQAPDIVVASQLYDWDGVLTDIITKHQAGVMGGSAYALTLGNGGLVMKYADSLDAAAVAAAQEAEERGKQPIKRTNKKVGRNDPCPCGSGKKFKQCHGA